MLRLVLVLFLGKLVCGMNDPFDGEAMFADLMKFTEIGTKRTASEGDHATSQWLVDELTHLGLFADHLFTIFSPWRHSECLLIVDGLTLSCFPLWIPSTNIIRNATIYNRLGDHGQGKGSSEAVCVLHTGDVYLSAETSALINNAVDSGCVGILLVNGIRPVSPVGDLQAINGVYRQWPVPIAVIPTASENLVRDGASVGVFQITGNYYDGFSRNSLGVHYAKSPKADAKNIVISTSTSCWFTCGSERGPGIALWLALARWVAQRTDNDEFNYYFVGNTGNEVDSFGLELTLDILNRLGVNPETVIMLFDLGPTIVANQFDGSLFRANCHYTEQLAGFMGPLAAAGFSPRINGTDTGEELQDYIDVGFTAAGMFGRGDWFNMPSDSFTSANPEQMELTGRAIAAVLQLVERSV